MHQAVLRDPGPLLPRLIDQRGIADELGVTSAAAEKIMQQVPKVHVPGLRKVYVKRDDVVRMIEWNKGVVRRVRLHAGLCTDLNRDSFWQLRPKRRFYNEKCDPKLTCGSSDGRNFDWQRLRHAG